MMRLKLLTARFDGQTSQQFGDIIEVPSDEGRRMIKAGIAMAITADEEMAETAMLATGGREGAPARSMKPARR